jgi:hypothetical protein
MSNRAVRIVKHALAAPGANTDAFTAFTPNHQGAVLDIDLSLATGSIVDLRVTDGTTAYSQALWDGASLTAGQRYSCSVLAPRQTDAATPKTLTYSIRVRTDGIIQTLTIHEAYDR